MAKVLLVFGAQAKVAELSSQHATESIKEEFLKAFPDQISTLSPTVLQSWDTEWNAWLDIGCQQVEMRSGQKFRLVPKEKNIPQLGNLDPETCAFFCCDMQDRFKPAISHFDNIALVSSTLLKGANALGIPIFVTEQYPKGLLHTVPELDISNAKAVIDKTVFSMMIPEMEQKLQEHVKHLRSVILFGVEAHVCVQQTALDLIARGVEVHIIADGCSSRSTVDRILAFERLRSQGAVVTTAETVLLQLVKDKNHPKFKEIQGLIKTTPPQNGILNVQSSL